MLGKTPTGIEFFDAAHGGAFRGRAMLVSGPAKSGKSVIGTQFIARGLKHQEHCLMLSAQPARDVAICAEALGVPFVPAVESGNLILLEYSDFIPGRDTEHSMMLPTDGFRQLQEIVAHEAISRMVIDTILPWVALPTAEHLAEHVYSFVRAFERMGVTVLMTMPRPASVAATRLHRLVEEVVPISVLLLHEPAAHRRTLLVNKYLGGNATRNEFPIDIVREQLVVEAGAPAAAPDKAAIAEAPARRVATAGIIAPPGGMSRIRLADTVFDFSPL